MADIGKAPEGFPRRMQAARALAGLTIDQLAAKLKDEPGLSPRSLRDIESGKDVQRSRQRAIIEACGVPSVFVDADLMLLEAVYDGLTEIPDNQRGGTGDGVLVTRALRLYAEQQAQGDGSIEERLARLERIVLDNGDGVTGPVAGPPPGPLLSDTGSGPTSQKAAPRKAGRRRSAPKR